MRKLVLHRCVVYASGFLGEASLRAMVERSFGRMSGRVHGQTAIQIPHDADSAKYGMHLSKSTYQRSMPRTICFTGEIAPGEDTPSYRPGSTGRTRRRQRIWGRGGD